MICELKRPTSFSWRLIYFEHYSYRWPETFRKDVQRHCPKQTSLWVTTLCQGVLCLSLPGLCSVHSCRNWETPQLPGFQREHSSSENPASQKFKYPKLLATCISWLRSLSHAIKIMTLQKEKSGKNFIFITYLVRIFSLLSRRLLDLPEMKL